MPTTTILAKSSALAALTLAVVGGGLATPASAGHKHHHHGFRVIIGAPVVYGGYGYSGYSGHRPCYWLYRKAQNTGSPYWWKRFQECRYGY